ncbi:MAG: ribosome biogenesis GTP-binding protein YihA/YsxC [Alicyclobacillaceae bacterium]|nr:ribosome biogenesis GTP-binding protein YihA/YsxC [Alicyclobacillaceae bacterium]
MIVKQVSFELGAVRPSQWPRDGLPEFAFIGRSNVGKSSLLNRLLQRKSIARVSQHPGKTQQINFYRINDAFRFADLPGYGYATVSKLQRAAFQRWIKGYIELREPLARVLHLVDIRHEPSKEDVQYHQLLQEVGCPMLVIATKQDKISKSAIQPSIQRIASCLQTGATIVPVSATNAQNIDSVWRVLDADILSFSSDASD